MEEIKEDMISEIVIDFEEMRNSKMSESMTAALGAGIELMLRNMFGRSFFIPVNVRGTSAEIKAFAAALAGEKRYIEAYKQYGLDNPQTHRNLYQLERSVKNFERKTGIKWPFK